MNDGRQLFTGRQATGNVMKKRGSNKNKKVKIKKALIFTF